MTLGLRLPGLELRVRCAEPVIARHVESFWRPASARVDERASLLEFEPGSADLLSLQATILERVTAANADAVLLHAAALLWDGVPWLLLGESNAGKSSFTRELLRRGAGYLSDDLLVLRAGRLQGVARAVQFDPCLPQELPPWFRDCELLPVSARDARVVPIERDERPALRELELSGPPAVIVQLERCGSCRVPRVERVDSLARLRALHGASLTVGRDYDGSLGFGPTFDVWWSEPSAALDEVLMELRSSST